jgi:hypothetical protein
MDASFSLHPMYCIPSTNHAFSSKRETFFNLVYYARSFHSFVSSSSSRQIWALIAPPLLQTQNQLLNARGYTYYLIFDYWLGLAAIATDKVAIKESNKRIQRDDDVLIQN